MKKTKIIISGNNNAKSKQFITTFVVLECLSGTFAILQIIKTKEGVYYSLIMEANFHF